MLWKKTVHSSTLADSLLLRSGALLCQCLQSDCLPPSHLCLQNQATDHCTYSVTTPLPAIWWLRLFVVLGFPFFCPGQGRVGTSNANEWWGLSQEEFVRCIIYFFYHCYVQPVLLICFIFSPVPQNTMVS